MNGRRAAVQLLYEDTDVSTEISGYLLDLSYSDNGTGKVDDLQITIEDRSQLWQGDWMARKGDTLKAAIITTNWNDIGEEETLYCGSFEIDGYSIQGPPDVLQIKAVSLPFDSRVRFEKKSKVWENVSLKRIASDIASNAGFTLLFDVENPPPYDRAEQSDQSDLAFLHGPGGERGCGHEIDGQSARSF
ncbi:phage late control D family protein [Paenibacillus sp. TAB 01]|uniref:phage late control D family protein n=1 Tax=Paenibacillus sp. TAB 01 TaxID=3368988 RepID=UPI003750BA1E